MIFVLRTFKWGNEAKGKKAQVHCVIIGFSDYKNNKEKKIFDDNSLSIANNINPYLVDAPDIIVERRKFPICDVPELKLGNLSRDGGNLILEEEEKNQIINENKIAEKWIKPFMGAEEFLNDKPRWCLWLVDASPHELRKCKSIMKRIENVKKFRINSKRIETQKLARTPTLFAEIRQPSSDYLIVPRTTSENRKYIPMDFVKRDNPELWAVAQQNLMEISRGKLCGLIPLMTIKKYQNKTVWLLGGRIPLWSSTSKQVALTPD